MSVPFDAVLGDDVRRLASEAGVGFSSWPAGAAAAKLRAEALRDLPDTWEAEYGALTADELGRAEAELGLQTRSSAT